LYCEWKPKVLDWEIPTLSVELLENVIEVKVCTSYWYYCGLLEVAVQAGDFAKKLK